jgi:hypothetical protein
MRHGSCKWHTIGCSGFLPLSLITSPLWLPYPEAMETKHTVAMLTSTICYVRPDKNKKKKTFCVTFIYSCSNAVSFCIVKFMMYISFLFGNKLPQFFFHDKVFTSPSLLKDNFPRYRFLDW